MQDHCFEICLFSSYYEGQMFELTPSNWVPHFDPTKYHQVGNLIHSKGCGFLENLVEWKRHRSKFELGKQPHSQ
ncbi:hypothetical protein MRB53_034785 [Persea americana]|uniref:Uncharacterized protein n=1 Tax=Persea americana TaxID=3435 RepID=A0ACC2K2S4_PERAE|nr:hypothetical protein MRB53_034785 [Persea americana]